MAITRAAIYARVSTAKQKDNYSLPSQLKECRNYCQEKGYTVAAGAEYQEVFSGAESRRPKLDELRQAARQGQYDVIVTLDMDRWSRGDEVERYIIDDEFRRAGVSVEYVLEQFDPTPEGELQKQIRGIIAAYERKKFIQRAKRGRLTYVEGGHIVRGRVDKYGYRYVNKAEGRSKAETNPDESKVVSSNFEIVPEEAEIVRKIYEWYVFGDETGRKLGHWAIAQKLTKMGVPTRYDKDTKEITRSHKKRPVSSWASIVVGRILADEAYAGKYWYGKHKRIKDEKTGKKRFLKTPRSEWIAVPTPPIVSRELWEAARKQAEHNEKNATRNAKYRFLLTGIARCSVCNGGFYGNHSHGRPIYRCKGTFPEKWAEPTPKTCHGRFRAELLEPLVWETIKALLKQPKLIKKVIRERQTEFKPELDVISERLDAVVRKIAELEITRAKLIDLYLIENSTLSKDTLAQRDAGLKSQLDDFTAQKINLENQLNSKTFPENALKEVLTVCEQIRAGIDAFTQEDKRYVLQLLKVSVMVQRGETPDQDTLLITGYLPTTRVNLSGEIAYQSD